MAQGSHGQLGEPGGGGTGSMLSEINVTPFVDVMLVLLVIFMITAPLMQHGINVNLPETSTEALRLPQEPLVLSVRGDGAIFVGRAEVPLEELEAKLRAIFASRADESLYLRADREAPYGQVVQAMGAARRAGALKLGIVTEPEG